MSVCHENILYTRRSIYYCPLTHEILLTHEMFDVWVYREEQITDPAALKASLTPAAWYELAKEPNLADKFHKAIMECKKQMPAVASALDKPFRFCLWYYYHKYKIPSNSENYQSLKKLVDGLKVHLNSDDCAICDEGGDLVCCETCTDSVSWEGLSVAYLSSCFGFHFLLTDSPPHVMSKQFSII